MGTQQDPVRIGDRGRTLTALKPSGKVAIAGAEFEARSEGQWIDPDCNCVVVAGDSRGLIVRAVGEGDPTPAVANQGTPALTCRSRAMTCLRCNVPIRFVGTRQFHEGMRWGVLGDLGELFVNREEFDVYICPRCGHVDFFVEGTDTQSEPRDA